MKKVNHIFEDENYFGCVVNSDYGQLDFYDNKQEKQYVNIRDFLYDDSGKIGSVKISLGFFSSLLKRPAKIEVFSNEDELLSTVEAPGDQNCFVFRDAETNKALAVAIWGWIPTNTRYLFD